MRAIITELKPSTQPLVANLATMINDKGYMIICNVSLELQVGSVVEITETKRFGKSAYSVSKVIMP